MSIYSQEKHKNIPQKYRDDSVISKLSAVSINFVTLNWASIFFCLIFTVLGLKYCAAIPYGIPWLPILVMVFDVLVTIESFYRRNHAGDEGSLNAFSLTVGLFAASAAIIVILMLFMGALVENNPAYLFAVKVISFIKNHSFLSILFFCFLLFTAGFILAVIQYCRTTAHIRSLADSQGEISPEEFLKLRANGSLSSRLDFPGVYILRNTARNKYYVGQSVNVFQRLNQHFTGHGNEGVYSDWVRGDAFTIRMIRLDGSGFKTLNSLERNTISVFNAYTKGYNKTKGNHG